MLLFSRQVTFSGSPRRLAPWVTDMTAYVNEKGSVPVTCWALNFGAPLGTFAWTSLAETQGEMVASEQRLLGDAGYNDRFEAIADAVTTPGEDRIARIIYGTPGEPPQLGAVAQVTRATAVVDRMADAVGFAVGIAQYLEGVIGSPIAVLLEQFGTMGGITWIGIQPDIAAADTASAKLAADAGYVGKVAGSKDLFIPGSGHVTQSTRVA